MQRLFAPPAFRLAFYLAATVTLVSALIPEIPAPPPFPYADKLRHFAVFAVLGGLARLGFPAAPARLIVERLAFLGAGIEVLQTLPFVHRDADVLDWAADIAGVALALPIATRIEPLLRRVRG